MTLCTPPLATLLLKCNIQKKEIKIKMIKFSRPFLPGQVSYDVLNFSIDDVLGDNSTWLGEGRHPRVADVVDQLCRDQRLDLFPLPRHPEVPEKEELSQLNGFGQT
jgi:hypothetical protein